MIIDIVCGRSGSGKSHLLYNRALERARKGKKTIIVVPEQFTLQTEHALLDLCGQQAGIMDVMVMSITRLMNEVFDNIQRPESAIIDAKGRALVLKSILRNHGDELDIFTRVAGIPGFATSLNDLLSDLKRFDITSDQLINSLMDADPQSTQSRKINDIIHIMQWYEQYSQQHSFVDGDDAIHMMCDILGEDIPAIASHFMDTAIYFDAFDYLPPRNIRILAAFMDVADEICVALTMDINAPDSKLFAAGFNSSQGIEAIAAASDAQVRYVPTRYVDEMKPPALRHLEHAVYALPRQKFHNHQGIRLIKALGIHEEVESTASDILDLVASSQYRWRDIKVLCSNLDQYARIVARVFQQFHIPYFLDDRRTVSSHPAVVWLLSSLNTVMTYQRSPVFTMIKTRYTPLTVDECEIFEDYCINQSINGHLFRRSFRRGRAQYDLDYMNQLRQKAFAHLADITDDNKPAKEWAQAIFSMMQSAQLHDILSTESQRLEAEGRLDEAAETVQAWNAITETLDQLHSIIGDTPLSMEDIIALLEEAFINAQVGILPTGTNSVLVGDTGRSKSSGTQCLFLLGANEGMLPRALPEGNIFGEQELQFLQQSGITAGRSEAFKRSESAYSLYIALAAPSKEIQLSYDASNEQRPAFIINELQDMFPGLLVEDADVNPFCCDAAAFTLSAKALGAIGDSRHIQDGRWKSALSMLMNDHQYDWQIDKMYNFAAGGNITQDIAIRRKGHLISSVSQLEEYARCPFAYMITYGLLPQDDPHSEVDHTSTGAFLHKLMEEFGQELASNSTLHDLSDDQVDQMMRERAEHLANVFDDGVFQRDQQAQFLSGQLIETARRGARVYLRQLQNSSFKPIAHELVFNTGRSYGPIQIKLPDGQTALLTGKIDRVDEYNFDGDRWLCAVDYKSGRKSADLSGIMTGQDIQLFVYMDALCQADASRAAGVFYYPLRNDYTDEGKSPADSERLDGWFVDNAHIVKALDRSIEPCEKSDILKLTLKKDGTPRTSKALSSAVKSTTFFNACIQASHQTAQTLCEGIDQGKMDVNPIVGKQDSSCTFCDYQAICRFGAQVHDQRNAPDASATEEYIQSFMTEDNQS